MQVEIITAPGTGKANLWPDQMQDWAAQNCFNREIEAYCLDAPEYVPNGSIRFIQRYRDTLVTQADFCNR